MTATTQLTVTLRTGKVFSYNPNNIKQLKEAIGYMNDEKEVVKLVKKYGDDALKTAWRVNAKGKKMAAEAKKVNAFLRSPAGQALVEREEKLMTSQPDFMPKLGDPKMGYR